jgi:hypothetical protein
MDPRPRLGEPSRMTNTTEHTTDVTTTVDGYLAARNERDPERRGELIARVRARDGRLVDPPLAGMRLVPSSLGGEDATMSRTPDGPDTLGASGA